MSTKHAVVANSIREQIVGGELEAQQRLPGEDDLAKQFGVSRGTVRQALASLQREGLIRTSIGSGSYVSFDGRAFDDSLGWAAGTARAGTPTIARVIAIGRLSIPTLAARIGLDSAEFLAIDRVRQTEHGESVSIERSRVPWKESLQIVLRDGLIDESLTSTLAAHDLQGVRGSDAVTVASLGSEDAGLLGRRPQDVFLRTERVWFGSSGQLTEHVVSLLDPQHFALHYEIGG